MFLSEVFIIYGQKQRFSTLFFNRFMGDEIFESSKSTIEMMWVVDILLIYSSAKECRKLMIL
ncbi:hypothetical Protein YC6258_03674 [Gynuella sunshinyii YC6258]|uniref:Uncharacterized protein n=1 Tax=Gynuella sunshinyii YC6258 TaxID=1445510 RepID=A0A0C5V8L0_9GAMM|nr:hypothetical Protein YC6258_03674 [Gynuella sunshinyii YC6258]